MLAVFFPFVQLLDDIHSSNHISNRPYFFSRHNTHILYRLARVEVGIHGLRFFFSSPYLVMRSLQDNNLKSALHCTAVSSRLVNDASDCDCLFLKSYKNLEYVQDRYDLRPDKARIADIPRTITGRFVILGTCDKLEASANLLNPDEYHFKF